MFIDVTIFILFIAAWVVANIILDICKGIITRKQHEKLIDTAYLKISKLIVSTLSDLKKGGN